MRAARCNGGFSRHKNSRSALNKRISADRPVGSSHGSYPCPAAVKSGGDQHEPAAFA